MENDMQWRTIKEFPEHEISEDGQVRRIVSCRRYKAGHLVKPKVHQRGYLVYSLNNKDILAHRLVAIAYIGPAPTDRHEVAHEDGSRTNNHWSNLSWKLPSENQEDRKRHGTYMQGDQCHWTAKISDNDAEEIRSAYADGGVRYRGGKVTMDGLARKYGISPAQVSRIVNAKQRINSAASPR